MNEVLTLEFEDGVLGSGAVAIVRQGAEDVALSLSLEQDGDIEVTMPKAVAAQLASALRAAAGKE